MLQPADRRVFLGLNQPPLISAVDWLIDRFRSNPTGTVRLDLSEFIVVVPTLRAQQRFLQLLVAHTDAADIVLTPPVITSLGQLPEYLYDAEKSLANELSQQIAWSMALQATPEEELKTLTGRQEIVAQNDWQPLAAMISQLHQRLANDIWSFRSVASAVKQEKGFLQREAARWDVLNSIQQRYYSILQDVDLWDKQAARNYAAAGLLKAVPPEIRCSTDKQIVMVAAADLNQSVSEMLRQIIAKNPEQVHILVAADPALSGRFDLFGSLITEAWLNVDVPIRDEQIMIVDQPADQAYAAAEFISNLDQPVAADEITIGVPDATVIPQVERSLNAINLAHRNLAGRPLSETSPVRLLIACREYLQTSSYESLSSLVRHPDLFQWLSEKVGSDSWLSDLTEYQRTNLPSTIPLTAKFPFGDPDQRKQDFDPEDEASKQRAARAAETCQLLNRVHTELAALLKPLDAGERPIAAWTWPWSQILLEVYGQRLFDRDDQADLQTLAACEVLHAAFANQAEVPEKFETSTTAHQALQWALEAASEHRVVVPPIPEAVEIAGWLDLALDDAPVMVVTGMNDESVPSSENGHQFLPNELCKKLKILDNDRRFARDCYALGVILAVRRNLRLIAGRRDERGEPLKPSRLLFADNDQTSARRAKAFFSYIGKPDSRFWLRDDAQCPRDQQFKIPRPIEPSKLNQISVTKFREYIKCPYRFYLNLVLRLETVSDDWRELDGGLFGDLTHNVLESFGRSPCRDSIDEREIYQFLSDKLDWYVEKQLGGSRLPAVKIQVEQLRLRLERFSAAQAKWREQGWQIVSTEEMLVHDFDVDGEPFVIRGKIDRVDQNERTGQVAVWDYKSSDKGDPPGVVHYAKRDQKWKDLQLPLYRHLVKEVSAVAGSDFENIILGYILLPKKLDDVGFHPADWSADLLETADEAAREIIRQLRNGVFWPPAERPPLYSEDFAAICQDHVFERHELAIAADSESGEAAPW